MIPFVKFFNFTFSQKEGTDMKSQAYRMAMLFDFYGDVLTPRQKEFYDLYYNEDLSLLRSPKITASPARVSGT